LVSTLGEKENGSVVTDPIQPPTPPETLATLPGNRVEERTRYSGDFWDADRVLGCLCDEGWTGFDCSEQTCPYGDDPSSYGQKPEEQLLRCAAAEGSFTLRFRRSLSAGAAGSLEGSRGDSTVALNASAATARDVQRALEALPSLGEVAVVLENVDGPLGPWAATSYALASPVASAGAAESAHRAAVDASERALARASSLTAALARLEADAAARVCRPRAAGDVTLTMPRPPFPVWAGQRTPLALTLSGRPAGAVTVSLDALSAATGRPTDRVRVWPRNLTVDPGEGWGREPHWRANGALASPLSLKFNATASGPGAFLLRARVRGDPEGFVVFNTSGSDTPFR
jgi:hypothetical protein